MTGTTRTPEGANKLRELGIDPVIVNVLDGEALKLAVKAARPSVVIHQLTDLSAGLTPEVQAEVLKRNARLRREGTYNLVAASRAAGVQRLIAQSIAWAYAPHVPPYHEDDPLDEHADGLRAVTVGGVIALERAVIDQNDFIGIVLRYGELYGDGTWSKVPHGRSPVHVDAAAYAALLAINHGRSGAYNIAEPEGAVVIDKALEDLGWQPDFRLEHERLHEARDGSRD